MCVPGLGSSAVLVGRPAGRRGNWKEGKDNQQRHGGREGRSKGGAEMEVDSGWPVGWRRGKAPGPEQQSPRTPPLSPMASSARTAAGEGERRQSSCPPISFLLRLALCPFRPLGRGFLKKVQYLWYSGGIQASKRFCRTDTALGTGSIDPVRTG